VDVLWHDNVAEAQETMVLAGGVESLHETSATRRSAQERKAMVATESYEMEIVAAVEALKRAPGFRDDHFDLN
jgi:hypothetical protein